MRVAYAVALVAAIPAGVVFAVPPPPYDHDGAVTWPVYLAGPLALAAAFVRPRLLTGRLAWMVVCAAVIAGTFAGLVARRVDICCMFVVSEGFGYPLPWVSRYASYEALDGYRPPPTFATDAKWSASLFGLLADIWYWAAVGLVAAILISCVGGRFRRERPPTNG